MIVEFAASCSYRRELSIMKWLYNKHQLPRLSYPYFLCEIVWVIDSYFQKIIMDLHINCPSIIVTSSNLEFWWEMLVWLVTVRKNGFEEWGVVNLASFLDHCQVVSLAFFKIMWSSGWLFFQKQLNFLCGTWIQSVMMELTHTHHYNYIW